MRSYPEGEAIVMASLSQERQMRGTARLNNINEGDVEKGWRGFSARAKGF